MSGSERTLTEKTSSLCKVAFPLDDKNGTKLFLSSSWKNQLDFERGCCALESGQRCWLSAELDVWNKVMHAMEFEIVEPEPGRLHLRSLRNVFRPLHADSWEASFLLSWLLEHHKCIDAVSLCSHVWFETFLIRLHCLHDELKSESTRHFRCLKISLSDFVFNSDRKAYRHCYTIEGIDAVRGLEKLKISTPKIDFKLAAELETLLRWNSSTLKTVKISKTTLPRNVNYALQCLTRCESLELTLRYSFSMTRFPSMVSVAQLLRSTTALKELSIFPIGDKRQVSVIAEAIKANTSLTVLKMFIAQKRCTRCTPEPVFAAMEVNSRLKELHVSGCSISSSCGQALTLALGKNCSLRDLRLADITISSTSMIQLAEALLENNTLQNVYISGKRLPMSGISALCMVLSKNKNLKMLTFAGFEASRQERSTLAKQLFETECYNRVQLPWVADDMPGLLAALTPPSMCPGKLCLPMVEHLPEDHINLIFEAIAYSTCIHTLRIHFNGDFSNEDKSLFNMLTVNRSIKCLHIIVDRDTGSLVPDLLLALAFNTSIIELRITIHNISDYSIIKHVSFLLAHNKMVTKFVFASMTTLPDIYVDVFAQGLWQNKQIIDVDLPVSLNCDDSSFTVFEALRRNRGILNRAVEFVVLPRAERQYAEAFELFFGKPCLLAHLIKVTGRTETEALAALTSANHYLQDNYLIITGVILNSVKCYPGNGTQLDKLNGDCWRAIVQCLNLSDVLLP